MDGWERYFALIVLFVPLASGAEDELDFLLDDESANAEEPARAGEDRSAVAPGPSREAPVTGGPSARVVEEIVVTAQKRTQNLQDVPIAISVLDEDAIRERQIESFADMASQIPSLQYGEGAGAGQIFIRGVGLSMLSGSGEGSVAVHMDGLFLPRPTAVTMLQSDLGGIEVLRGPQGTLYGRNSNGGVINLVTVRPPAEGLEATGRVGVGNLGSRRAEAAVGGPIVSDLLNARLSFTHESRDDYIENVAFPGQDVGGRDYDGARASFDFLPNDRLAFELRGFLAQEDGHSPIYTEPYRPGDGAILIEPGSFAEDPYEIRMNHHVFQEMVLYGGTLKTIYDWSPSLSFSAITGYSFFEQDVENDDGDGTSNRIFRSNRGTKSDTFSQEVLLHWHGPWFSWLGGGYYLRDDLFQRLDTDAFLDGAGDAVVGANLPFGDFVVGALGLQDLGVIPTRVDLFDRARTDSRSYAAFTDATVDVWGGLRAIGGLRYLVDRKEFLHTSANIVKNPGAPDIPVVECENALSKIDERTFTGRLGAQYLFSDDLTTHATYSTGFKAGGFNIAACDDAFVPEEIDAYEIGLKSSWLDRRIRANVAAFYYDYTNLQVEQLEFPALRVANAQAEVFGAELELLALLFVDGLELDAGLTWLAAEYLEFSNADSGSSVTAMPEDVSGNPLNRSPTWAALVAPQYHTDIGAWGRALVRGEIQYSSTYTLREFDTPDDRQDAYTRLNGHLRFTSASERFWLGAFVKNATDEVVFSNIIGVVGNRAAGYELPRTFGAEVGARWGG